MLVTNKVQFAILNDTMKILKLTTTTFEDDRNGIKSTLYHTSEFPLPIILTLYSNTSSPLLPRYKLCQDRNPPTQSLLRPDPSYRLDILVPKGDQRHRCQSVSGS